MDSLKQDADWHARTHAAQRSGRDGMRGSALRVAYRGEPASTLLEVPGTLAVFDFGAGAGSTSDARHLRLPLPPLPVDAPHECWSVDAEVASGSSGNLRWAAGGGWRFVVVEIDEAECGGIQATSARLRSSAHARGGLPGKASATHLELPRRDQRRQRRR